jgi:predicted PurR-regulated permease PerM
MTWLALLSLLLFLVFAVVLVYALLTISRALEKIGNREPSTEGWRSSKPSYLARIALGVSAIEKEVSALGSEAPRLNDNLEKLAGGLQAIKTSVVGSIGAVERQGR